MARKIRSIEESNYLIGNRTRDLPAYIILPQPEIFPEGGQRNSGIAAPATLPSEETSVPRYTSDGWAPELDCMLGRKRKVLLILGMEFDSSVDRPVELSPCTN
jgi:hypothetical protein